MPFHSRRNHKEELKLQPTSNRTGPATPNEFSAKSRIKTSHSGLRVATKWAICFSIKPLSHDTRFRSDSAHVVASETVSCSQEVDFSSSDKDWRTTTSFTMEKSFISVLTSQKLLSVFTYGTSSAGRPLTSPGWKLVQSAWAIKLSLPPSD